MTEVVTVQNPPALKGPSDKEKKYDRQLRLWAASGQQALEDAVILLINSGPGAVGIETLKNLVLPGIGKFIIYDESTVTEADLGVNFFLDEDCLGKSRAESCVKFLQELNPDVEGDWFPKENGQDLEWMLYVRNPQNKEYALIIYTLPFDSRTQELLARANDRHHNPIIGVHSAGFYSYFRTYLPGAFPIVETHPDSTATTDLRLLTPWEELKDFAAGLTKVIETLSDHEHGHIPYVVLLLYYLEKWKEAHGSAPTTYKEKIAFRDMVRAGARVDNAEGGEENFDEAVAAVLKTISAPTLSSNVKEVFAYRPDEENAPKTESESPLKLKMKYEENYNSNFWVIVDAIKTFYSRHNALPLPGSVPDMKAQSTVYVQLQNIYKAKARKDAAEVFRTVGAHPKGSEIDAAEVESFCKNAAFIKLIRGDLARGSSVLPEIAKSEFENDENAALTGAPLSLLPIYLALTSTSLGAKTSTEILESIERWLPNASENTRLVEVAEEVARAKGGELHNISALTGGMVAQEAIKLITKQYIPIDNTCIFDGITSRTQVLRI